MRWLLDTVTLSAARRPERSDPGVIRWLESQNPYSLFLSAITIFEIELGTRRRERAVPDQGAELRVWAETVSELFAGRILAVDERVAARAARMHVPDPRPERDALIAATADVHNLTVVTRNVKDFEPLGARVFNPWT